MSTQTTPVKTTAVSIATLQVNQVVNAKGMRTLADQIMPVITKSLPAQYQKSASRYAHALVNEMMKSPQLAEATALSLMGCMMQAATLGLEIGSALGHAYPVPRWDSKLNAKVASLQIGYKGFIALAGRSDKVASFDAHVVYEGDTFDIDLGSSPKVTHKPAMKGVRENPIGYYAVLKTSANGTQVRWMTQAEMVAHRNRYADAKSTPWNKQFEEMGRKTVLRALSKYTPISVELSTAASLDEADEHGIDQNLTALGQLALEEAGAPPAASPTEQEALNQMREPGEEG